MLKIIHSNVESYTTFCYALSLDHTASDLYLSARHLFYTQISYASTSVTLSGRPNFFRTVPSDESLPPALATVMQYYGWREVAIVTEREPQFLQLLPILNRSPSRAGISIVNHFTSEAVETIFVRHMHTFHNNL